VRERKTVLFKSFCTIHPALLLYDAYIHISSVIRVR